MGNTNQWKIRDHRLCTVPQTTQSHRHPLARAHPHHAKDKNRSPFHGEKPNQDVGNYNLNGRDMILHVRLSLGNQFIIPF